MTIANRDLDEPTNAPAISSAMVQRGCLVCSSLQPGRVLEAAFDPTELDRFAFASRKMPEHMHCRLIECTDCDLLYANPLPQLEALASAYCDPDFDGAVKARCAARTYATQMKPSPISMGLKTPALKLVRWTGVGRLQIALPVGNLAVIEFKPGSVVS